MKEWTLFCIWFMFCESDI